MNKYEKLILKAFLQVKVPNFTDKVLDGKPFFTLHDYYAGYVEQLLLGVSNVTICKYLFTKKTEQQIDMELSCFDKSDKIDAVIYLRLFRLVYDMLSKYSIEHKATADSGNTWNTGK